MSGNQTKGRAMIDKTIHEITFFISTCFLATKRRILNKNAKMRIVIKKINIKENGTKSICNG